MKEKMDTNGWAEMLLCEVGSSVCAAERVIAAARQARVALRKKISVVDVAEKD